MVIRMTVTAFPDRFSTIRRCWSRSCIPQASPTSSNTATTTAILRLVIKYLVTESGQRSFHTLGPWTADWCTATARSLRLRAVRVFVSKSFGTVQSVKEICNDVGAFCLKKARIKITWDIRAVPVGKDNNLDNFDLDEQHEAMAKEFGDTNTPTLFYVGYFTGTILGQKTPYLRGLTIVEDNCAWIAKEVKFGGPNYDVTTAHEVAWLLGLRNIRDKKNNVQAPYSYDENNWWGSMTKVENANYPASLRVAVWNLDQIEKMRKYFLK